MSQSESIITDSAHPPQHAANRHSFPRVSAVRLALLSALLLWLSHSPVKLFPVAYIALAPLLISLTRARKFWQAFGRAYLCGLVFMGMTCYWIGLTIVGYTGSQIGWLAWLVLMPILALYYGLWGSIAWRLSRNLTDGGRILAYAVTWVVVEWLRTLGSLSMPWAQLSYSQYLFTPALQWIDVTGAYGLSFLIVLMNGGVAYWVLHRGEEQSTRWVWLAGTATLLVCLTGTMKMLLPHTPQVLKVAITQGNFPMKGGSDLLPSVFETVRRMTRAVKPSDKVDLVVWSESTLPLVSYPRFASQMTAIAKEIRTPILSGAQTRNDKTGAENNSALLFGIDGTTSQYDKQHLVPFGEYIPYRNSWPESIAGKSGFDFFPTDLTPGTASQTLSYSKDGMSTPVTFGVLICYEGTYPPLATASALQGANILFSLSNDAWSQSHSQREQHLASIVMRAAETRRDIVRSTNNGISCVVDAQGRIAAQSPTDTETTLTYNAEIRSGLTPYVRFGDWLVALCALVALLLFRKGEKLRKARTKT